MDNILLDENYKYWLDGFIEGEGSLVISVVKTVKHPLVSYFNLNLILLNIIVDYKFLIPFYKKYVIYYSNKYKI